MKEQVEKKLGFEVTNEQYGQSKERARKKLNSIISRYGDANGNRRKPEYLRELIYEDVISDIFSKATIFITKNVLDMEKEHLTNCQGALTE